MPVRKDIIYTEMEYVAQATVRADEVNTTDLIYECNDYAIAYK